MSKQVEVVIITGQQWLSAKMAEADAPAFIEKLAHAALKSEWFYWTFGAVRGSAVTGWYLREIVPSPTDRIATAIEKASVQGEDWK